MWAVLREMGSVGAGITDAAPGSVRGLHLVVAHRDGEISRRPDAQAIEGSHHARHLTTAHTL
ncbi:MAG: hypothetical protein ACRDRM_07765 [Pseudonocardiaceae bacterium]